MNIGDLFIGNRTLETAKKKQKSSNNRFIAYRS